MAKIQSTLTFITESLPGFEVGEEYAEWLAVSGGTPPYSFEVTQGALPAGINLTPLGTVVGVPTVAGDTTVWIKATDSVGSDLTQAFDCQVTEPGSMGTTQQGSLTFITESLPAFTVGEAYQYDLQAVGGTQPYNFAVTQGALPSGIGLSSAGRISGTATQAGDSTAFVKLSDTAGANLTQAFDCQVN